MRLSRSGVIIGLLIVVALFVALALVGKATADLAADEVTSVGTSESTDSGSLLGGLAGTCAPAPSIEDILRNGAFAPIDNGRIPVVNAQDNLAGQQSPVSLPVRLRIPAIHVDARIIAVAEDSRHQVIVPYDISTVGWFEFGPAPGSSRGSCVMVAHRDGVGGGCGAFYDLGQAKPGDAMEVILADGSKVDYRVTAREVVLKTWFAKHSGEYFTNLGDPRLTLITCGGEYVKSEGGYQSNIIVTARPITAAMPGAPASPASSGKS
ncbi:MAG: hypothetical protein RL205_1621 [Actinomycetota bacterium]